ncbi:MAG: WG repeat-containing protein, partial [Bacteroidetes bacterium]|nr:WG repeat-containing protein [Bacteroidota bacterium]
AVINGKEGFIDKNGNWVIQPIFDQVYEFEDGLSKAEINGKFGFIDKNGNWIIQPIFDCPPDIWDSWDGEGIDLGEDDDDHEDINYDFNAHFGHLQDDSSLYLGENIKIKKYRRLVSHFNDEFIKEFNCSVYYDNTIFGRGDDGFAIGKAQNGYWYIALSEFTVNGAFMLCFEDDGTNNFIEDVEYVESEDELLFSFYDQTTNDGNEMTLGLTNSDLSIALAAFFKTVLEPKTITEQLEENSDEQSSPIKPKDSAGIR